MFGVSSGEIFIILIVFLILFGPKKIPEIARAIGKAMREFRKITDNIKEEINKENSKK